MSTMRLFLESYWTITNSNQLILFAYIKLLFQIHHFQVRHFVTSFYYEHEPEACLREALHSAENFKSAEISEYQGCINLTIISSMSSARESETFGVTKTSHGRRSLSLLCKLGSNSTVGHFFLWDESDSMLKNPFYNCSVLCSSLCLCELKTHLDIKWKPKKNDIIIAQSHAVECSTDNATTTSTTTKKWPIRSFLNH